MVDQADAYQKWIGRRETLVDFVDPRSIANMDVLLGGDGACAHKGDPIKSFSYQAHAPLFADAPFSVAGKLDLSGATAALWAAGRDNNLAMTGKAAFAD